MLKLPVAVMGEASASVTFAVKLNVPVAVGAPVMFPFASRANPVGRGPDPDASVHVYGPTPPVACSVVPEVYARPRMPFGSVAAVTASGCGGLTVIVAVLDSVGNAMEVPVTLTVKPVGTLAGAVYVADVVLVAVSCARWRWRACPGSESPRYSLIRCVLGNCRGNRGGLPRAHLSCAFRQDDGVEIRWRARAARAPIVLKKNHHRKAQDRRETSALNYANSSGMYATSMFASSFRPQKCGPEPENDRKQ